VGGGGIVTATDEEDEEFFGLVLHVEGRLRDAPPHKKKDGEVSAWWLTEGEIGGRAAQRGSVPVIKVGRGRSGELRLTEGLLLGLLTRGKQR
jgi:hypothetical protein